MLRTFTGQASYDSDVYLGPHRLLVAVRVTIGDMATSALLLLDTGSEWCVLSEANAAQAGYPGEADPETPPLHSRFGLIYGRIERIPFRFVADVGEELVLDATCFVSADWPGPPVLGWKGCLERMRFALDPADEMFSFATL